jgi:hypothetical protein
MASVINRWKKYCLSLGKKKVNHCYKSKMKIGMLIIAVFVIGFAG